MANINRLVWNDGFTNDKRAHVNKEPFKKSCNKCKKVIWMKPEKIGWKPLDLNGKPHECKKKKKAGKKGKNISYMKACKHCDKQIRMKMSKGKWIILEPTGERHRCDKRSDEEILDSDLLMSSPLDK